MKERTGKIKNRRLTPVFIAAAAFLISMLVPGKAHAAGEYEYLSDIPYVETMTKPASTSAAWGVITMDQTADTGADLSLMVDGTAVTFRKGIFAHAESTVVYDLTDHAYDYFSTYYGVSSLRGSSGSVKFYIYTSADGSTWELKTPENPDVMTGASNAGYVKIPLAGVKYIKLYANPNGANGQDHAIYGDAKLFNEGYSENVTPTVEEYDRIIKEKYNGEVTEDFELTLLQREFVKNAGSYTLRSFVEENGANREVLDWLMNDEETLRLYLAGGKPEGSYLKSLEVLSTLYRTCGDDLKNETVTTNGVRLGDLYRTMMLSISLTHSGSVYLWVDGDLLSDPVERYEIYKELHADGLIQTAVFESLTVEEMRWVMNTVIDDEEIKWLNWYVRNNSGKTSPYAYIRYTFGYNYALDKYYDPANYDAWEAKYNLKDEDWDITYKAGFPKLWVVFEEGSVCGGLSKTGSCIWGAYQGLPNTCVCQPGHCAYIYYTLSDGKGVWNLGNDVSGWAQSGRTEHLNVRMMNDWGSNASGWGAPYILLAQAAQNEYEKYEQAEITMMLADVYKDDAEMLESIYRKALEVENIHFEAWEGLVDLYLSDETKTQEEYYNLAEEIAEVLTYYPKPMYDLISRLEPKLTSAAMQAKFAMLKTRVLTQAAAATSEQTIQVTAVRQVAQSLLGAYDGTVATFSFDGENAGKIVLGEKFGDSDVTWDYSLDGGKNWSENVTESTHLLTEKELASITAENDIKVHIIGVDYSEENIYTIDIKESTGIPSTVYANDLENKVIAATDAMEWRFAENEDWTSFAVSEPDLTGNKTVFCRVAATGVYLASATPVTYTFTEDNQPETRVYIPIEHLSLHQVSSEETGKNGHAVHMIDGNMNTIWHSAYNGSDSARYITIKLDEPRYISALEYIPRQSGTNGRIKDGSVMVSMDGVTWTKAADISGWANNAAKKTAEFEPVMAQYVKLTATANYGDGRNFISGMMLNLFENKSIRAAAQFSFDGENAGVITLLDEFKGQAWEYSLDGGETWKEASGDRYPLSEEELGLVDAEDDIQLRFKEDETLYSINIVEQPSPAKSGYLNDWENRIIGFADTADTEWKLEGETEWKAYKEEEPVVSGENTLLIRKKASGVCAASEAVEYQFTADDYEETKVYIPIAHLSIADKSSETTDSRQELAVNAIDGNANTMWHTIHDGSDTQNYITVKLSEPMYVSALQYLPKPSYEWGVMKDGVVSVSMDGETWTEAGSISGCAKDDTAKMIAFEKSVEAQYVKLQITSHDNVFASTAIINLYRDMTKEKQAVVEVAYSTTQPTNGNVVASLSSDIGITVTNNGGSSRHTFTENGEFTFEYEDENGNAGSVTASVTWIDREAPDASIVYSDTQPTRHDVAASLICEEPVTVMNNEGKDTYVFTENGSFEFIYQDALGNEGRVKASVDWINREAPEGEITYTINSLTNKNVTALLTVSDGITITNNDGQASYTFMENGSFTFTFVDELGNEGSEVAVVDWIDKEPPKAEVSYERTDVTKDTVTATLSCDEAITILNNNGSDTYVFEENGSFEFIYEDAAGNKGRTTAEVNWIDRAAPEAAVTYDISETTNKDVTASLKCDEVITILNNDGKDTYVFKENGKFEFVYRDAAGNEGRTTAEVTWIDKTAPEAHIMYDVTDPTNGNVTATLICADCDDVITVLNNDGSHEYTFTENGNFEFIYRDEAGNEGRTTAEVDWIDREAPVAWISYDITVPTKEPVTATLKCEEPITVVNNDGNNTYVFTVNGSFEFIYCDAAGNENRTTAEVDWIGSSERLQGEISYDITETTNKDVTATLTVGDGVVITNNDGKNTYIFSENGSFTFIFEDKYGNEGSAVAEVDWIDKTLPEVTVTYDRTDVTNESVIASLNCEEPITIMNNDGKDTYTFTENGSFEFIYRDKAGNEGKATAMVDWIDREVPEAKISYDITDSTRESVTATLNCGEPIFILNNDGKNTYTFKENGSFEFVYCDAAGNENRTMAVVDWIEQISEPESGEPGTATMEYKVIEGADSVYEMKTDGPIVIKVNGEISKFRNIEMDGKEVDSKCYTVEEGSTIITFMEEYLNSLTPGTHQVRINYTDGSAETTITVKDDASSVEETDNKTDSNTDGKTDEKKDDTIGQKTENAKENTTEPNREADKVANRNSAETGDSAAPVIWLVLMVLAGGMTVLIAGKQKKKTQ